jgi:hypothetical protein
MSTHQKRWKNLLELDAQRNLISGDESTLCDAIRRGADLRIYTEFLHNEHIDVESESDERIEEVSEFAVTYLVEDSWAAGVMSLRQPIELPTGFGPRPSMSFFLYNQNGQQAIARPYLDGTPANGVLGASPPQIPPKMPKYHTQSSWDIGTNAPSSNFIYDFDVYRFMVRDDWQKVLSHSAEGEVLSGSIQELATAAADGCQLKVGVRDLCADFGHDENKVEHEVVVQAGPCYFYTEQQLMIAGSHPLVRVRPSTPMLYESRGWDFGWLMLRSDGHVVYRRCDPYSLAFDDIPGRYAIRWFVR